MMNRKMDTVLFDLGSTLIYPAAAWPEFYRRADQITVEQLAQAGYHFDPAAFRVELRRRREAYENERGNEFLEYTTLFLLRGMLIERGYSEVKDEFLKEVLRARYAVTQANWLPEADALPTLDALRRAGYRLGMISNASDDIDVQTLVDKAGLRSYFDVILVSAAEGIRKPNPEIFHRALGRIGSTPERAVMVGDTLGADILGAQNAQVYSIWITRRANAPANRDHADTIRPDARIAALGELPSILESLG
jgi:HAD superfamily hydrolase (TIGR01549 family)